MTQQDHFSKQSNNEKSNNKKATIEYLFLINSKRFLVGSVLFYDKGTTLFNALLGKKDKVARFRLFSTLFDYTSTCNCLPLTNTEPDVPSSVGLFSVGTKPEILPSSVGLNFLSSVGTKPEVASSSVGLNCPPSDLVPSLSDRLEYTGV